MRLPKSVMHSASDATRTENPFSSSPQSGRQESEKNFFMKCPGRFPTGIFFTYFFKILIAFQNLPAEFDMLNSIWLWSINIGFTTLACFLPKSVEVLRN